MCPILAWLIGPAVLLVFAAVLLAVTFACTCTHFRRSVHATMFRKIGVILSAGSGNNLMSITNV